jgi:hypothetical protein
MDYERIRGNKNRTSIRLSVRDSLRSYDRGRAWSVFHECSYALHVTDLVGYVTSCNVSTPTG